MNTKTDIQTVAIDIGREFSDTPFGRDEHDGDYNGKRFLNEFLRPRYQEAKNKGAFLVISFDNVELPVGSSFLTESFVRLATEDDCDKDDLLKRLKIVDRTGFYELAIRQYLEEL